MKSKIILALILIVVVAIQSLRIKNIESFFQLNQKYSFQLEEPLDGNLNILKKDKILVLYQENENSSQKILEGIKESFDFSRVDYDLYPINTEKVIDIKEYSRVIITAENYHGFRKENFQSIKSEVFNGMPLFILQRSFQSPFNSLAGIKQVNEFKNTKGLVLEKEIFPGLKDLKLPEDMIESSGIDFQLEENLDIIAHSLEGVPLIWKKEHGKGKIIYTNATFFQGKIVRGLMKQLFAYYSPVTFYPILNSKVVHIDDYPAPIPEGKHPLITAEYGMKIKDFYNDIWWEDMKALAAREKLKYSTFAIIKYNAEVEKLGEITIPKRTMEELSRRGREVKMTGGEIGLHGYNHNSLGVLGEINFGDYGYTPWENIRGIKEGIEAAKDTMKKIYGEKLEIYSYVAPSNLLGKSGKAALVESLPSLKVFSGVFYGAPEQELGFFVQEIGRDKDYPQIYSIPRFSSGFVKDDGIMWQIFNGIAGYGYLSHFIHPDDLLDAERGKNKSWGKLKIEFGDIFSQVNKKFPMLQPSVQSELTREYMVLEKLDVDYGIEEGKLFINTKNFTEKFYAQLRLRGRKISRIEGGEIYPVESKDRETNLYIVKIDKPSAIINLEEINEK